nr:LysM peptidoglycan-binding domain-containing protein [Akkermansia sp.]
PFLTIHQKTTIMKTTKTPDHNPTGRTRPKRKMGTVLRAKLSKYRARVSEFEDDAPSSTVVRWLVVLLLLHLLVIGGVYVRSTWFRNTAETVEMAAALPAPPTVPQRPAPAAPPAALSQVPQAPPAAPVTITQPEQVVDARPNRQPAPAVEEHIPDAAPVAGPARHIVRTGDTWERVARDNQVAVNDLKAVNPKVQRLVSGSTLVIPARPGDKFEPEKSTAEELEPEGVPHIVKKGETLSVIARKYKMNWRTLQKFNKMNDRDVARLKIGQKIMIPKK